MKDFIVDNVVILAVLLAVLLLLIIVLLIINWIQIRHLTEKYDFFMRGKSGQSIEESLGQCMDEVARVDRNAEHVKRYVQDVLQNKAEASLYKHYMKRYDAFEGMGGELSFVLLLLDENNSGYLLNNVQGRENAHIYAKNIVNGECRQRLSEEEEIALKETIAYWDEKMANMPSKPAPAAPEPRPRTAESKSSAPAPVQKTQAAPASSTASTSAAPSAASFSVTRTEGTSRTDQTKTEPRTESVSRSTAETRKPATYQQEARRAEAKRREIMKTEASRTETTAAEERPESSRAETAPDTQKKTSEAQRTSSTSRKTPSSEPRKLSIEFDFDNTELTRPASRQPSTSPARFKRTGDDLMAQETSLPPTETVSPAGAKSAIRPAKQSLTKITGDEEKSAEGSEDS